MKNLKEIIGTGLILFGGLAGGCNEELMQGLSRSMAEQAISSTIRNEIEGPRSQPANVNVNVNTSQPYVSPNDNNSVGSTQLYYQGHLVHYWDPSTKSSPYIINNSGELIFVAPSLLRQ